MAFDPTDPIPSTWLEYRRLVLAELERLNTNFERLSVRIDDLRDEDLRKLVVDVAMLKIKCASLGGIAGVIAAAIVAAVTAFRGHP